MFAPCRTGLNKSDKGVLDQSETAPMPPIPAPMPPSANFWLIRHAPSLDGGAMAGRRDVDADCRNSAGFTALSRRVGLAAQDRLFTSPALRCQQTAAALFGRTGQPAPALWEQDFGAWEGLAYADLPDLGTKTLPELAAFTPPQGESFADVAARVGPWLMGCAAGRHVVVAHAGVIRAALGMALEATHLGLGFVISPLSLTCISRDMASGAWAVHSVNWTMP